MAAMGRYGAFPEPSANGRCLREAAIRRFGFDLETLVATRGLNFPLSRLVAPHVSVLWKSEGNGGF
jgi:hypothetical protein